MTESQEFTPIFQNDELGFHSVDPQWGPDDLLAREGVFFLKDIVKLLELDSARVKKKAWDLQQSGVSVWDTMGARKMWNHWVIRMKVFAPYYREHLAVRVRAVASDWDGNILLSQKGLFFLAEVCDLIPFSPHQLRYQTRKAADSRKEIGIWKDTDLGCYLVEMEVFANWVRSVWGYQDV